MPSCHHPPTQPRRCSTELLVLTLAVLPILVNGSGCSETPTDRGQLAAQAIDAAVVRARPVDGLVWPDPPDNGSPVAAEWVRQVQDDGQVRAEIRLFNFGHKETRLVSMKLHYLDKNDQVLKQFPWNAPASISPQSHGRQVVGAFMTDKTVRIRAEVVSIRFTDNTSWAASSSP